MMRAIFKLTVLSALFAAHSGYAEDPKPGMQVALEFQDPKKPESRLGYLLYLPQDYGQGGQKSPLLLFLHGSGERGQDISLVKKHGPPKLINQGHPFPFVVVSPQCPADQRWNPETLLALLDDLNNRYSIDVSRQYVTGLSMGGSGTWSLIAAAPNRFAAAVPICGRGDPGIVDSISRVPVWIVVGDRDNAMLVENCQSMANALQERKSDVKLTMMRGIGHDSWTQTYATPELYDWMLRRQKQP